MDRQGSVWWSVVTLVTMVVLTFVLGVPTAVRFVVQKLWAMLTVLPVMTLGVWVGLLGDYGGPLGLPVGLLWAVGTIAGSLFVLAFVVITKNSWAHAMKMWRELSEDSAE